MSETATQKSALRYHLLRHLGDGLIRTAFVAGKIGLVIYKAAETRQISASAAVRYAQDNGMPFNHPQHAMNAFLKLRRTLEDVCHGEPSPVVLWACWAECVHRRHQNTDSR